MECQVQGKTVRHSDPRTAPEMFTVTPSNSRKPYTACLAHAIIAEARGRQVNVIRS
jgi:hypothetical protein